MDSSPPESSDYSVPSHEPAAGTESEEVLPSEGVRRGYKRLLDREPGMRADIEKFEGWLEGVEQWLDWIDKHFDDGQAISRKEVFEDFHISSQGLDLMERLHLDIHADREGTRVMYDPKKLLRAVVAMPTLARLKGKKLTRKHRNITTVFKEVINDTLTGRLDVASISSWEPQDGN